MMNEWEKVDQMCGIATFTRTLPTHQLKFYLDSGCC
jgi:hypothetical protein